MYLFRRKAQLKRTLRLIRGYLRDNPPHEIHDSKIRDKEKTNSKCRLVCLVTTILLAAPALMSGQLWLVLVPAFTYALRILVQRRLIKQKSQRFEKDYTALLLSVASAIRTGLDPLVALSSAEKVFPIESELREQLRQLNLKIQAGNKEDEAILSFACEIDPPDIRLFRTAFLLARKEGSSLSACLQRLAKVTRQRQSFRRKAKAAVAMQRLSSFGIAVCTVFIVSMQTIGNRESLDTALSNPLGQLLLGFGFSLVLIGMVWMLAITRTRT